MIYEPCICASLTVALAFLKCGLVQYPGVEVAGEVVVTPIGIPARYADQQGIQTYLNQSLFCERFGLDIGLPRQADSNKGTYGHVLVAAGTRLMSGAGLLCFKVFININAFIVYCTLLVFSNTNHFFISGHSILGTEFSYRKCSRF